MQQWKMQQQQQRSVVEGVETQLDDFFGSREGHVASSLHLASKKKRKSHISSRLEKTNMMMMREFLYQVFFRSPTTRLLANLWPVDRTGL